MQFESPKPMHDLRNGCFLVAAGGHEETASGSAKAPRILQGHCIRNECPIMPDNEGVRPMHKHA